MQNAGRTTSLIHNANDRGIKQLLLLFICWKVLLLSTACFSPGPGYDTSTQILFDRQYAPPAVQSQLINWLEHVTVRLTRWDGIYFANSSARGHLHEQEWAFSWVLARFTSTFPSGAYMYQPRFQYLLLSRLPLPTIARHALSGIIISNISHLLSVFVLYRLSYALIPSEQNLKQSIAFTTASLHIVSPAGIFLSAPSGESAFALFNFLGILCYIYATLPMIGASITTTSPSSLWTLAAGASFGIATTIRSNGLLSGIPFAWDVLEAVVDFRTTLHDTRRLARLLATICAGSFVGAAFLVPQAVAYHEYCMHGNVRPWCNKPFPSIYSWVQSHYWGVGFLRYWTMSNLPLFLLAGPMLAMLFYTGYLGFLKANDLLSRLQSVAKGKASGESTPAFRHLLPRLALPQLILAAMAVTNFHVQIVNRISSGYPLWYILLAIALHDPPSSGSQKHLQWIVRSMVMYAIVQGGLYASFLPPA